MPVFPAPDVVVQRRECTHREAPDRAGPAGGRSYSAPACARCRDGAGEPSGRRVETSQYGVGSAGSCTGTLTERRR